MSSEVICNKRGVKLYAKLFISVFSLSAFTVGGGYVIVPLMRKKFVDKLGWIKEEEMLDLVAIAQSSPGAMAVNTAVLVGYRVGGVLGAVIATLGSVMPPLIIITAITLAYAAFRDNKIVNAVLAGIKIGVAAVIVDVVINMISAVFKKKSVLSGAVLAVSFILVALVSVNVIYVLIGAIVFGVVFTLVTMRRPKGGDKA